MLRIDRWRHRQNPTDNGGFAETGWHRIGGQVHQRQTTTSYSNMDDMDVRSEHIKSAGWKFWRQYGESSYNDLDRYG